MSAPDRPGGIAPNHRVPRTLGILNIVFAANLMGCGLCFGLYAAAMPALTRGLIQAGKQAQAAAEAKRQAEVAELAQAEAKAETAEEKAALKTQRATLQSQKIEFTLGAEMDPSKLGFDDPRLVGFGWAELLSGLALNLALLASGIALIGRRRWAPRFAMAVAATKIVRLVLLYGFLGLALAPRIAQKMGAVAIEQIAKQQGGKPLPPGLSAEMLVNTYMITITLGAVGMVLFGSIYPAVSLWYLSRPGIRAACAGAATDDREGVAW